MFDDAVPATFPGEDSGRFVAKVEAVKLPSKSPTVQGFRVGAACGSACAMKSTAALRRRGIIWTSGGTAHWIRGSDIVYNDRYNKVSVVDNRTAILTDE